jgi:hypothetical protein
MPQLAQLRALGCFWCRRWKASMFDTVGSFAPPLILPGLGGAFILVGQQLLERCPDVTAGELIDEPFPIRYWLPRHC